MKKYIKPAIRTRKIVVNTILAGSLGSVQGEYKEGVVLKSKDAFFEDESADQALEEE